MAYEDYIKAQKTGLKAFKASTARGQYPYLPVLDEILSHADIECEVSLGVVNIPLSQVVGTSTFGRTQAFASNFMPLLDYGSEFSVKWSHLVDAQIEEGIHDAIKVYEYMNKYYVIEGNKRVSVLKYFDSPSIAAEVTRKVPKRSDDLENQIYYEFMDFYKLTKINYVQFSKLGSYSKLLTAIAGDKTAPWTDDECMDFSSFHTAFYQAFKKKNGNQLPNITCDDALLFYLSLYPYDEAKEMLSSEIKVNLDKIWPEILLLGENDSVELLMDPTEEKKIVDSVFNKIRSTQKKVAFVYDKDPSASNWIYGHELGRLHLEEVFGSEIETRAFITDNADKSPEKILEDICDDGYDIIFTVTPQLIKASLKVAAAYPNVKILNCALNSSHNSVRTYYTRMYEAKFLTGIIAGAMCKNDKIGYVADYPIYGTTANINAFALGAKMVNPRAKIYLTWSSQKDFDILEYFKERNITYISAQDMITPQNDDRQFGLYAEKNDAKKNLAVSIYHWGAFYEELINSIMRGSWKVEKSGEAKALNYWWGLSAGVIDVICSNNLPVGTTKLVNLMKKAISSGVFHPFTGPLTDQDGNIRCQETDIIKPEEIIKMDWLSDNVIGEIPSLGVLEESARPIVELRGLDITTEKGGTSLL
ncbi:MAG: BMP family ABC transporter substrate-binding protein [Bacteroidales bacterium]|nr:BMP family ABC transporter substrate-binding protein [Clostridium sp.]MCM1204543.1 BMP family ABC transporter substrate-binding protein [Bacteroidales bacterium]